MMRLLTICALVALTFAQDHQRPDFNWGDFLFGHHTSGKEHEHSELGTMTFYYEPQSHYLVAKTNSYCYVKSLDTDESKSAHTQRGLEDLEIAMMNEISGGEDTVTSEQLLAHGYTLDRLCSRHTFYKVGPLMTKTTTTVMP